MFIYFYISAGNDDNHRNSYDYDKYDDLDENNKENKEFDISDIVTVEVRHGSTVLKSNQKNIKQKKPKKSLKQTNVKKSLYKNRVVFVDTETTGLSNEDEFIEVTAVLGEFNKKGKIKILDKYNGLRKPNVEINPNARKVHKIKDEELINSELNYDKLNSIFKKAHFITAHNASFDKRFLVKEFEQLENKFWLCSMNGIKWIKRGFDSKGLQNLLDDNGIEVVDSHRADSDVMAMIKLLNCKASPRTTYFNQLLRNNKIKQKNIQFD
jgi:DNA polymerase-3 subunit epsilon